MLLTQFLRRAFLAAILCARPCDRARWGTGDLGVLRSKREAPEEARTRVAPASPGQFHGTIDRRRECPASVGAKYPKSSPPAFLEHRLLCAPTVLRFAMRAFYPSSNGIEDGGSRISSGGTGETRSASGRRERLPSTAFVDSEVSRLITTRNRFRGHAPQTGNKFAGTNWPEIKNPPERRLGRVRMNGLPIGVTANRSQRRARHSPAWRHAVGGGHSQSRGSSSFSSLNIRHRRKAASIGFVADQVNTVSDGRMLIFRAMSLQKSQSFEPPSTWIVSPVIQRA